MISEMGKGFVLIICLIDTWWKSGILLLRSPMWINWLIIVERGLGMRVKFIIRKSSVKGLELRLNGVLIGL